MWLLSSRPKKPLCCCCTKTCITYSEPQVFFSLHIDTVLVILYPLCKVLACSDLSNNRIKPTWQAGLLLKIPPPFWRRLSFAKGNSMFRFEVIGPLPRPSSLQWSKVESEKSLAGGLCKNVISLLRMGWHVLNHWHSFKCQYTQMLFGCAWSSLKYAVRGVKGKKSLILT